MSLSSTDRTAPEDLRLSEAVGRLLPKIVEIRHDLHAHPELGYEEHRTSGVVVRELKRLGIKHRAGLAGGTGVLAWIPATNPSGECIALRADMDALPIEETTGLSYASTNRGVMHACGHDGHTSILLGAANVLVQRERRPNDVLLIFQPAEEGGGGGKRLCDEGALEGKTIGRKVDRIFGLHGHPWFEAGHVAVKEGPIMAAAIEFSVVIRGKGAHAAMPHISVDPIVVAAQIVTALQTIASRNTNPLESVVVTVGEVHAGVAHNVIPDVAIMKGTVRSLRDAVGDEARSRLEIITGSIAQAFGAKVEISWSAGYPVTVNDRETVNRFREQAREAVGQDHVHELEQPLMAAEDFSFYGRQIPACFFFLGLRPTGASDYPNLHASSFDFNDLAIPLGIELMVRLAESRS